RAHAALGGRDASGDRAARIRSAIGALPGGDAVRGLGAARAMDARAPGGLLVRGARAPGSWLRDSRRAVPRGAAPARRMARSVEKATGRSGSLSVPGDRRAAADARADRAARRRRDAEAPRRRHGPHALG